MLHDGSIAEMKTGEGKTLVSTLAAYLNALAGDGVHGMLCVLSLFGKEINLKMLFFIVSVSVDILKGSQVCVYVRYWRYKDLIKYLQKGTTFHLVYL